jgi:hypothetical protein
MCQKEEYRQIRASVLPQLSVDSAPLWSDLFSLKPDASYPQPAANFCRGRIDPAGDRQKV